jgi:hypothetical protein
MKPLVTTATISKKGLARLVINMSGTAKSLEIQSLGIRIIDELRRRTMSIGPVRGSTRVSATKIPNEGIEKMVIETRTQRRITYGMSRPKKALTITEGRLIRKVAAKM